MNAGYVYVIAFDNGMVKVGRTQDTNARFNSHEQIARSFGLKVTDRWESPRHGGWLENEQALMRLARELGGMPTTPEYFNGVSFDALAAKARELPYESPGTTQATQGAEVPQGCQGTEALLREEIAKLVLHVQDEWVTEDEATVWLANLIYPDRDFTRRLIGRYARKRLRAAIARKSDDGAAVPQVSEPGPPEPEPPQAAASHAFYGKVRPLLATGLTVGDALDRLAERAA